MDILKAPMDKIVQCVLQEFGGAEKMEEFSTQQLNSFNSIWNGLDTESIGRILRSHLVVEHYMTEYIEHQNPNLGRLQQMRLSFNLKVGLLGNSHPLITENAIGVRHLNKIRNRLAHNLHVTISRDDANVFQSLPMFKAFRDVSGKPGKPSNDPLDILEAFAIYAASIFRGQADGTGEKWSRGIEAAQEQWAKEQADKKK